MQLISKYVALYSYLLQTATNQLLRFIIMSYFFARIANSNSKAWPTYISPASIYVKRCARHSCSNLLLILSIAIKCYSKLLNRSLARRCIQKLANTQSTSSSRFFFIQSLSYRCFYNAFKLTYYLSVNQKLYYFSSITLFSSSTFKQ